MLLGAAFVVALVAGSGFAAYLDMALTTIDSKNVLNDQISN